MTEAVAGEIAISREEGRSSPRSEEDEDLLVTHAFATDIVTDLSDANTPTLQSLTLAGGDILVQDIHASAY